MSEESLERRVLRRLVFQAETLSRNQNFHAFDSDDGRRLLRLAARLRSLLEAIRTPGVTMSCSLDGDVRTLVSDDPETGVHRETILSEDAFAILVEDEQARSVLLG